MTTDMRGASDAVFRARVDRFNTGQPAEEGAVEKVARAIHDTEYQSCRDGYDDCQMADHYRRQAVAAIDAMRGPTADDEMAPDDAPAAAYPTAEHSFGSPGYMTALRSLDGSR